MTERNKNTLRPDRKIIIENPIKVNNDDIQIIKAFGNSLIKYLSGVRLKTDFE